MKVCYTGWTWIKSGNNPKAAKTEFDQSFRDCKFLVYDYVENFAFISDYYKEDPQELVRLAEDCGVKLVNLYGHLTCDTDDAG